MCCRAAPPPACLIPGLQWCFRRVGKRVIIDASGNLILQPS